MSDLQIYITLLINAFLKPIFIIYKKIYQSLPNNIKNKINSTEIVMVTSLGLLLILIINYFWPRTDNYKALLSTGRFYLSPLAHARLAEVYFNNGNLSKAQEEINLAKTLYGYIKFFDINHNINKQLQQAQMLIDKPEKIEQQIQFLEKKLQTTPHVRDYYLQLSLWYFQLKQYNEARENWQRAFYIDPNNSQVQEIGKNIGAWQSEK